MTVFPKSKMTILTMTILTTILKDILKWQHMFSSNMRYIRNYIVTLASPNLLGTRKCKEKQAFLLHFPRFFVTLRQYI